MTQSSRIRILPDEAVNKVAAGEVVERPAAALKELLENGVDAGARRLEVRLVRSGKALIRVADDGSGMTHDEALLALERHATSKIQGADDLFRITTLGFRGEALPSMAAVSRLQLTTRARDEREGTRVLVDGGRVVRVTPCGCPEGTEVEVRDLFHNIPARLKFLRSDATELTHCVQVTTRLALACPHLEITLVHGNQTLLRLGSAPDPGTRLRDHLGRDFFSALIPLRTAAGTTTVEGYISRPGTGRPGADYQQFFVNARPVRDHLLLQAVKESCREHFLQEAAGISFFLWISLAPEEVDVNVHPTKREVRFRDLGFVRRLIGDALRGALHADRTAWLRPPPPPGIRPQTAGHQAPLPGPEPALAPPIAREAAPAAYQPAVGASFAPTTAATGQLFATYIVSPRPDGLVLIDQHAAHERILYERILRRDPVAGAQMLLHPALFEIAPGEEEVVAELLPGLAQLGIELEPFGPRSFRLCALPPELPADRAPAFLRELIARSRDGEIAPRVEEYRHRTAALLACHGAVRANQRLLPEEIAALLQDLARTENPAVCPHGRPTAITLDRGEIEKRFKRT